MKKGDLTHTFSLLVVRGSNKMSEEEKEHVQTDYLNRLSQLVGSEGTAIMELTDAKGEKRQFQYGSALPKLSLLDLMFKSFFILKHMPIRLGGWISKFSNFTAPLLQTLVTSTIGSHGNVGERIGHISTYHDRLDVKITKEEYGQIMDKLELSKNVKSHYHLLFNNCATYPTRIVNNICSGLLKKSFNIFTSPDNLSKQIHQLAKQNLSDNCVIALPLLARQRQKQHQP